MLPISLFQRKRRILCVCSDEPGQTSSYRIRAYRRLGQEVAVFDPMGYQPRNRYIAAVATRFPTRPFIWRVNRDLLRNVRDFRPDVVWFDKPVQFTGATIEEVKKLAQRPSAISRMGHSGPERTAAGTSFTRSSGCSTCIALHYPPPRNWTDARRARRTSYVGSPFEERPQFLQTLAETCGIPVSISGPRLERAYNPEVYSRLVTDQYLIGDQYRLAI